LSQLDIGEINTIYSDNKGQKRIVFQGGGARLAGGVGFCFLEGERVVRLCATSRGGGEERKLCPQPGLVRKGEGGGTARDGGDDVSHK
jgi:hypothetical protein